MDLSLIPSPHGGAQTNRVEPVECLAGQAASGLTLTANSAYLQLVRVTRPITVTKLSCYTSAATTAVDMAILDASFARLAHASAKLTAVAGGLSTQTLTAAFTYQPGIDYYHAIVADTTVAVVRGYAALAVALNAGTGSGSQRCLIKAIAQDTIPTSIASPTTTGNVAWIAGHN